MDYRLKTFSKKRLHGVNFVLMLLTKLQDQYEKYIALKYKSACLVQLTTL